ncbi:MAG: hypothetical protein ACK5LP_07495 [Campylobacteraceae bacterium]
MFDLTKPVEFVLVLIMVALICVLIAIGIIFVNRKTKKMKEKN